jgi:HEAT repeat protein
MCSDLIDRPLGPRTRWFALSLRGLSSVLTLLLMCLSTTAFAQVPGPELFAKEPRTPMELWDAIDYLLRTNQSQKALPFVDKFIKSKPDDATLIAIRNRYGPGSVLRLNDHDVTRPFAQTVAEAMVTAARKYASQPERIKRFIDELTKTPEEQDYGVRHLREAGPDAIPYLIEALAQADLTASDRRLILHNMGRLDRSVIPPLVAVLDSPDEAIAADAATVLGLISDKAAIPFLTFPATSPQALPQVRAAAQAAITRLTGQPFSPELGTATQILTSTAWRYHRHQVDWSTNSVILWEWNNDRRTAVAREVLRTEADTMIGLRLTHQALQLDPHNQKALVTHYSLILEQDVEKVGFTNFPTKEDATFKAVTASGPVILTEVLKTAIADGKTDLAAAAVIALAHITDRSALAATGRRHPLVDALYAPARRVQFTAAKALVNMAPTVLFPGSSQVVPTLARFTTNQTLPRAVVIDSNPNRGSQLTGFLINLGYDSELELTGAQGFAAAAETADVELILISYDLFRRGWGIHDTLANLSADSRTALIPIFIYGPLDVQYKRPNLAYDYPRIKFLVQPADAATLKKQLTGLPVPLTDEERISYARQATALLARISTNWQGPLATNLTAAEPALSVAVFRSPTSADATTVLGSIPDPDAQRSLAGLVLDPSQPVESRKHSAAQLVRSIKQFGPLVSAGQEFWLAASVNEETDPNLRTELLAIVRVLHRSPRSGRLQPSPSAVPAAPPAGVEAPVTTTPVPPRATP